MRVNDITTSIRLIVDECNIYTILNTHNVKRIKEKKIDFIKWDISDDRFKEKALLCWRAKKCPYIVPRDKPSKMESIKLFLVRKFFKTFMLPIFRDN